MKKFLIIVGIIFVLLVGALIVIPIIYEDEIYAEAEKAANEAVDAEVELGSVKVSLLRSFPKAYVELRDVRITGVGEFEDQLLLDVKSISSSISLSSLWSEEGLNIDRISIDNPTISLKVNAEGKANWDIVKQTDESAIKEGPEDTTDMEINLDKLEISDAFFSYTDESSPMTFSFENGQLMVSGKMHGSNSVLDTEGTFENINLDYEGANYMKNINVSLESEIQSDFEKMVFSFLDNEIVVNKLPLKAEGSFSMPDDYTFDIKFTSPKSQLGELLGLIPTEYQSYLEGVETDGNFSFEGFIKGVYSNDEYPAFGVDLSLKDGWLQYPDLPKKIEDIELIANISKPQGDIDLTVIDVSSLKASVSDNPISGLLKITTPVSDAKIVGSLDGRIDFLSLSEVIPMDSIELKGTIDMDVSFAGNYSDIEKEQYNSFKTEGSIVIKDFEFASNDIPERLIIPSANIMLAPKSINLTGLKGKMGRSDFAVNGSLSNYWSYLLNDKTLEGRLSLTSKLLDLNQLMYSPEAGTAKENNGTAPDKSDNNVIEIPDNIHFVMQASIDKMLYDRMVINNTKGKITIKDKKLILDGLNMNMLSGEVVLNGEYFTPDSITPEFNFNMNLREFDIPSAYKSLSLVRNLLPVASNSKGSFSSEFNINGKLGSDLSPILETLSGGGNFAGNDVEIIGAKVFKELSKYFVKGKFDKVNIDDFTTRFKIVDGGLEVVPFKTNIAGQEATFSGHQTVSQELNYKIDFKVNKDDLDSEVTKFMSFVPGMGNIEKLPVGVKIGGTFTDPKINVDMSEARKLIEAEFKKKSSNELQKIGTQLKKLFE